MLIMSCMTSKNSLDMLFGTISDMPPARNILKEANGRIQVDHLDAQFRQKFGAGAEMSVTSTPKVTCFGSLVCSER